MFVSQLQLEDMWQVCYIPPTVKAFKVSELGEKNCLETYLVNVATVPRSRFLLHCPSLPSAVPFVPLGQLTYMSRPRYRGSYSLCGGSPVKLNLRKWQKFTSLTVDSSLVVKLVAHRPENDAVKDKRGCTTSILSSKSKPLRFSVQCSTCSASSRYNSQVGAECSWPVHMYDQQIVAHQGGIISHQRDPSEQIIRIMFSLSVYL